jgi:phosphate starvation-inducible PhoH-like protein
MARSKKNVIFDEDFDDNSSIKYKKVKLSDKQLELFELIRQNKVILALGVAGTSKTFTALYSALKLLDKTYKKIIITKPTEIIGSADLGMLPGTLEDKLSVYIESFKNVLGDILEQSSLTQMLVNEEIVYKPVQYVRGMTFNNCIVVIDEIQSFDIKSLMALITRFGKNCKMVFVGDINQNDIDKKFVAVNVFKTILDGIDGIKFFEFERKDIVRDAMLIEITDRYEKMESEGLLTPNKKNT